MIELNDVDTSKPVTARLQIGSMDGSGWQDVEDGEVTLDGTGTTWSSVLFYNMAYIDYGDALGVLNQMRIVCDYTLTDGTEGTLSSTDCDTLYSYDGVYHEAVSVECKNGIITGVFQIDKSLFADMDPDKFTMDYLAIMAGEYDMFDNYWDVTDSEDTEMSGPDKDGIVTVKYKLNDEKLVTGDSNHLIFFLDYYDKDGKIAWTSTSAPLFMYHNEPEFTLQMPYEADSDRLGVMLTIDSLLNDLKGGSAKATLVYKDEFNPRWPSYEEYEGDDQDDWTFNLYHVLSAFEEDPETGDYISVPLPPRLTAYVHIDYTYPDGTEGSWDSEDFYFYGDDILVPAEENPYMWDGETRTLTLDFVAAEFITPETDLELDTCDIYDNDNYWSTPVYEVTDVKVLEKEDGRTHMIITLNLPDYESGNMTFYGYIWLTELENLSWDFEIAMTDISF